MQTNQDSVTTEISNHIARITFSTPGHNSMPGDVLRHLANTIKKTGEDPDVRVILLKSGGDRTFCAGANFDELMNIKNAEQGKEFFLGFAYVINAIRKCSKIVVGRVQGKAIGGGVGLAAAVDYCFATEHASVKLSELALGIGPFVVGPAIERKIGLSAFSQLALDATTWYPSRWAEQKGLYAGVFTSTEEMDKHVEAFIEKLSHGSPSALMALKQVLWQDTANWDQLLEERAAISGRLVITDAAQSAIYRARIA